jgi:hypothetical protein
MPRTRFNHVALSLPAGALDDAGRKEIVDFYESVFGWTEIPQMTVDHERLVLLVDSYSQFVYLVAQDDPMAAPRMDHFGVQVQTLEELDDVLARARAYQERDARVEIIDKSADDFGMLVLTSFYVRHLLPLTVEVQHFELTG